MHIRNCAAQNPAFARLLDAYENREKAARQWREKGGKVVGKMGFDVPDELIIAAGMLPIQIYADPRKELKETNKYLEFAFEPVVRAQFEKLIDGTYADQIDYLAISNSTDVIIRIFLYLRELHRQEPERRMPEISFIDILFTRHRLHQTRNEFVFDLFRKDVERWAGHPVTDEDIRKAGIICNENRAALRAMAELRHGKEVRISGSEAFVIISAGLFMERTAHTELVRAVTEAAKSWPVLEGPRVFFTGAEQEDTTLFEMIEDAGMVIVGDDINWGDRYYDRDFNMNYSVLRALVDRYMLREFSAKKATPQERLGALDREVDAAGAEGVIFYTHLYDEVAAFDIPKQKKSLEGRGIKTITFGKMLWPEDKNEGLQEKLTAFAGQLKEKEERGER